MKYEFKHKSSNMAFQRFCQLPIFTNIFTVLPKDTNIDSSFKVHLNYICKMANWISIKASFFIALKAKLNQNCYNF